MQLENETQLPREILSIFQLIYGLKTVSIWRQHPELLIFGALEKILKCIPDKSRIRYLIFPHTAPFVIQNHDSYLTRIKNHFQLKNIMAFETCMYKCVSFFKILEMLPILLGNDEQALVVTGEVAFTPKLRVVPRSTLVGDAATATLFSLSGKNHQLLSVMNKIIVGYEKGIFLSEDQLREFDGIFIQNMASLIINAVEKANISLTTISIILPHNVNIPTWKKISEALNFPLKKIYLNNIEKYGHCFCSDHLINLKSVLSENRLKKGDYYVMAGCGFGFYLSAAVFQF